MSWQVWNAAGVPIDSGGSTGWAIYDATGKRLFTETTPEAPPAPVLDYVRLASFYVSPQTSPIYFYDIDQNFYDLELACFLRTNLAGAASDHVIMRFNLDATAANYRSAGIEFLEPNTANILEWTGAAGQTGGRLNSAANAVTATADYFAVTRVRIYQYWNASFPRQYSYTGWINRFDNTTNLQTLAGGGTWKNAANAIDKIELAPGAGAQFAAGSRVDLYGVGAR